MTRRLALLLPIWMLPLAVPARDLVAPFEQTGSSDARCGIDRQVESAHKAEGLHFAPLCSDAVFVRRVYLDVLGLLPQPQDVLAFEKDSDPLKRAKLIDSLLEHPQLADYWTHRWCDILRVKSEFPINLWPNGVQAYHQFIRDAVAQNKPYDRFARELLTSSGSNFRVPAINFYRAVQGREPETLAAAASLTFMGVRWERWSAEQQSGLQQLFSRVAFKGTAEWKEEIVYLDPAPAKAMKVKMPDGVQVVVTADQDPRKAFADWLIRPDNPWFARNMANRVWHGLLGQGIVHPPDDVRPHNPPANPQLLDCLAQELIGAQYNSKQLMRTILNSRTYQQSSVPNAPNVRAEQLFACYPVRRLDAEVLLDAINDLFGGNEPFVSAIAEPFTIVPEDKRTVTLADGSIGSPFLEVFGRPARDTGFISERNNEPTKEQRLHLLNSTHIQDKIKRSPRVRQLLRDARMTPSHVIESLYLLLLSRAPTRQEAKAAAAYIEARGETPIADAALDVAWALLNSKEFQYRH